ncbi:MAG: FHA domain-containing protein [Planctomycetia bacterium]
MAHLVVETGPLAGKVYPIDQGLTIGREAHNTIAMPENKKCSRDHAKVWRESPGKYAVADLGSTNGTLVNDGKISRQPLRDGDLIAIGEVHLRFELGEDEKPKPKAPPARASLADAVAGKGAATGGAAPAAGAGGPVLEVKSRVLQYNKKQGGKGVNIDVSQTAGWLRAVYVGVALAVAAALFFAMRAIF